MTGRDLADAGDDGLDYEPPIPAQWEINEASDRAEARDMKWRNSQ